MQVGWVVALIFLAGCASEKLALAPPAGVDFSGQWQLDVADSDDPQRVVLSQNSVDQTGAAGAGGSGGQGGQGGRGSGRGGRSGGYGNAGPLGPVTPAMSALSDGLRWPGKQLDIKQAAGVVTITSLGTKQVYQPAAAIKWQDQPGRDRDPRARDRGDGPPPACGWDGKTLVVQAQNPDDERPPFEERYGLSEDGQRLIEVVSFKGGASRGFTVSRVWDRVAADK